MNLKLSVLISCIEMEVTSMVGNCSGEKKELKLSRYNWCLEYDGRCIAFNGYTGALAIIKPENAQCIKTLLSKDPDSVVETDVLDKELSSALEYGGFLIDTDVDERLLMRMYNNTLRYFPYVSGYTVVMTNECNFNCEYCYENRKDENSEIRDDVIDRIIKISKETKSPAFGITLYGGEPLLALEKCLLLCGECKKSVESNDIGFSAGIITNAYLLDRETARRLSEVGVDQVQVTIDGPEDIHNRQRPLRGDDSGTWRVIVENVKAASSYMKVSVRANFSAENPYDVNELKEVFKDYKNVHTHPAAITMDHCGDSIAFHKNQTYIQDKFADLIYGKKKLSRIAGGCAAAHLHGAVVLPNGDLVNCWDEVGTDETYSYGNIMDTVKPSARAMQKWMNWDPYSPGLPCYECKMLPSCGGGCPIAWVRDKIVKCKFTNNKAYERFIIENYRMRLDT